MEINTQMEKMHWQKSLRRNVFFSRFLIFLFFLMCFFLGLVIDVIIYKFYYQSAWTEALISLVTLQSYAYATLGILLVGSLELCLFLIFHRKFMRLGLKSVSATSLIKSTGEGQGLVDFIAKMSTLLNLPNPPQLYISKILTVNAFVSGLSAKNSIVVLTHGLLEQLEAREIQSIVLMQLCHIKSLDQRLTTVLSFVSNANLVLFDLIFHVFLYGPNRDREPNPLASMFFRSLKISRFLIPMTTFLLRFSLKPSRIYQAQKMTVKIMRENKSLAQALIKIYKYHFDNMEFMGDLYSEIMCDEIRREAYVFDPADINKSQTFATPFTTHPTLEEQLEAIGYSDMPSPILSHS